LRIKEQQHLPKGHKNRKSALTVCEEVNALIGSNVSSKMAAACVAKGLVNISPQKRGPSSPFPKKTLSALKRGYATFINLEEAGAKKQSTIRQLSL